jgi:hypothetical protein
MRGWQRDREQIGIAAYRVRGSERVTVIERGRGNILVIDLGHKTRPGYYNMQHWRFSSDWSCICVSWSFSYSTLFQSDLLPHLQSFCCTQGSALCFWMPLGGTWEHKALARVGYRLWRWGRKLPCWIALLQVSWFSFSLGRTLSEWWRPLQWGGCVPDVWT